MEPKPEDIFNSGNQPIAEKFSFQSKELEARLERLKSETEEEKILSEREIERRNKLSSGMNKAEAIQLKDDGSAVLKLKSMENAMRSRNVERGTYYKRERAAYLVDKFLGLNLVPPTVIRLVEDEIGSCQKFIEDKLHLHELVDEKFGFTERVDDYNARVVTIVEENFQAFVKLLIFDYLIWNSDRYEFNFLISGNKLWAIDNGLSFAHDSLGPMIHIYYLKNKINLSEAVKNQFLEAVSWDEGKKVLRQYLEELLSKNEVNAFFVRLDRLPDLLSSDDFIETIFKANYS